MEAGGVRIYVAINVVLGDESCILLPSGVAKAPITIRRGTAVSTALDAI